MKASRSVLAACLVLGAAAISVLDGAWRREAPAVTPGTPREVSRALAAARADLRARGEAFRRDAAVRASVEGGGVAVDRARLFEAARRALEGSDGPAWLALADPAGTVLAWWGEAPGRLTDRGISPGLSVLWTTTSLLLVDRLPVGDPPGTGGVYAGRTLPVDPVDFERALHLPTSGSLWAPQAAQPGDHVVLAEAGVPLIAAKPIARPQPAKAGPLRSAALAVLLACALIVLGRGTSAWRAGLCLAMLFLGLDAWTRAGGRLIGLAPPILALGLAAAPVAYAHLRTGRRSSWAMPAALIAFALAWVAASKLDPPELETSLAASWPSLLRVAALAALVLSCICSIASSRGPAAAGRGLASVAAAFSIAALLAALQFVSPGILNRVGVAGAALSGLWLWGRAVSSEEEGAFAVSRLLAGTALVTVLLVSPPHESRRVAEAFRTASAIRLPNPDHASAGAVVAAVRAAQRVERFDLERDLPAPLPSIELSDLAYRLWRMEERTAEGPRIVSYLVRPPAGPISRFSILPGSESPAMGAARSLAIDRHNVAVVTRLVAVRHGGRPWGVTVIEVADWPAWDPLPVRIDAYRRLLLGLPPEAGEATAARPFFASYSPAGDNRGEGPRLPPRVRRGLLSSQGPVRVTLPYSGQDLRGEIRREPDGWRLVAVPVPAFLSRFATAALLLPGIALFFAVGGALLLWRIATASPGARPALVPAEARTYRGRLAVVFVVAVLVPLFAVTIFLRGQIAARSERLTLESARAGLETARRVLDAYLAGFPPAERVTRLGDDVLTFVANSVGYDLSAFSPEANLVATSRRDLYSAGLLPDRVPALAYAAIGLEGAREQVGSRLLAGTAFQDLTTPLPSLPGAPGIRSPGLLSVLLLPQQRAAEAEASRFFAAVSGFSLLVFLLSAALAGRLALRVARPVADLVEATRAVARGDFSPRLSDPPDAELKELVRAFLTMSQSLRDQTEALSQEKERLATLLAHLTAGVVAYREDGGILLANPAAAALGGGEADSAHLDALFPGRENEPLRQALVEPAGDEVTSRELSPSPGARWRLITVPLPLGGGGARMAVIEDVSDVVRSNRLAAWAEMARIIAHEIKNPLTPIRLSVEHLREVWRRGDRDFGPVLDEAVRNVLQQTEELRRSASEFADYARLPEPAHREVRVAGLLEQAAAAYAAAPGVVWETVAGGAVQVRADPRLISRVLANLVGNSVEALAGRPGRIRLEAHGRDGRVKIQVSDDGPGVPASALPRLFEPYFSAKSGGTGLGLAIARRIVEEHGGSISAENAPGGGLRVTFDLPEAAGSENRGEGSP